MQTVRSRRQSSDALLIGKLFDDRGNRMTPTWAAKGGRRWRYYVSQAILQGRKQDAGSVARVSAGALEASIVKAVRQRLSHGVDQTASLIDDDAIRDAIERVVVRPERLDVSLTEAAGGEPNLSIIWAPPSSAWRREIVPSRTEGGADRARPMRVEAHAKLLAALRRAHVWLEALMSDPAVSFEAIAKREHRSERSVRQLLSLALAAPDIIAAAVERRPPRGFGASRLIDPPMDRSKRRRTPGMPAGAVGQRASSQTDPPSETAAARLAIQRLVRAQLEWAAIQGARNSFEPYAPRSNRSAMDRFRPSGKRNFASADRPHGAASERPSKRQTCSRSLHIGALTH